MYIRGLIPRNFAELAEAVLIAVRGCFFRVGGHKHSDNRRYHEHVIEQFEETLSNKTILGQVWCLIVSILDLCPLSYFL